MLLSTVGGMEKVWLAGKEECHAKSWKSVPRALRALDSASKTFYPISNRNSQMFLNTQLVVESLHVVLEDSKQVNSVLHIV